MPLPWISGLLQIHRLPELGGPPEAQGVVRPLPAPGDRKIHFDLEQFAPALASLKALLAKHSQSADAPEAIFLQGVARYKSTHAPQPLKKAYETL